MSGSDAGHQPVLLVPVLVTWEQSFVRQSLWMHIGAQEKVWVGAGGGQSEAPARGTAGRGLLGAWPGAWVTWGLLRLSELRFPERGQSPGGLNVASATGPAPGAPRCGFVIRKVGALLGLLLQSGWRTLIHQGPGAGGDGMPQGLSRVVLNLQ